MTTDEINDSGSFFNNSRYMRIYLATRRILTFEFGAVFNKLPEELSWSV